MTLLPKFDDTTLHRRGVLLRRITELESANRAAGDPITPATDTRTD